MVFRALNGNTPIRDPKISKLALFHGYAEKYGWTFTQIEQELGLKLNIQEEELSFLLKGVIMGQDKYIRKKTT